MWFMHRIDGTALEEDLHSVNQLRVIGGVCDCCLRTGIRFYDGVDHGEEKEDLELLQWNQTI